MAHNLLIANQFDLLKTMVYFCRPKNSYYLN